MTESQHCTDVSSVNDNSASCLDHHVTQTMPSCDPSSLNEDTQKHNAVNIRIEEHSNGSIQLHHHEKDINGSKIVVSLAELIEEQYRRQQMKNNNTNLLDREEHFVQASSCSKAASPSTCKNKHDNLPLTSSSQGPANSTTNKTRVDHGPSISTHHFTAPLVHDTQQQQQQQPRIQYSPKELLAAQPHMTCMHSNQCLFWKRPFQYGIETCPFFGHNLDTKTAQVLRHQKDIPANHTQHFQRARFSRRAKKHRQQPRFSVLQDHTFSGHVFPYDENGQIANQTISSTTGPTTTTTVQEPCDSGVIHMNPTSFATNSIAWKAFELPPLAENENSKPCVHANSIQSKECTVDATRQNDNARSVYLPYLFHKQSHVNRSSSSNNNNNMKESDFEDHNNDSNSIHSATGQNSDQRQFYSTPVPILRPFVYGNHPSSTVHCPCKITIDKRTIVQKDGSSICEENIVYIF